MSKFLLFAVLLLSLSGASWSQAESARAERPNRVHPAKHSADDLQQRRAAVRAAVGQEREQRANSTSEAPRARRQLTDEERQVLRQQLRQQRNDAVEGD